ncbi:MAG: FecR domain-containing protein [Bacteroidales bacterium]
MSKKNKHIDFESLTAKYLAGSATSEEVNRLEAWVKSDKNKQRLFYEIKQSWRIAATAGQSYDKAKAWEKITAKTDREPDGNKIKPLYTGTRIPLNKILRIAAAFLLFIAGSYFIYQFSQFRDRTFIAERETRELELNDGTVVSLNTRSSLTYPARFRGNERRVKLEGEGYFEVTEIDKKPFIVETQDIEVKVLGTSFYISARRDTLQVEVVVNSGKVVMITPDNRELKLSAGQKGIYKMDDHELLEESIENPNYLSWKTRFIVFENTSLREVFEVLGHTYGVSFRIAGKELENSMLTATFREKSLEDVLEIVRETFGLRYTHSDGVIRVSTEDRKQNVNP